MANEPNRFRAAYDFYPTPPEGTRALLSVEQFHGSIWEPACGNGAISKVLGYAGYTVTSTDLINRGFGTGGVNFLSQPTSRARNIITNPPYGSGLAQLFVRHALRLTEPTGGSVAMLLNLASLAHPSRHADWTRRPPTAIYVLDELACWPNGIKQDFPAEHRYCWLVWRPGAVRRPSLWWLSTSSFKE